ncbi:MAG: hypothetical protein M3N32_10040 [Actinomycetota bacterium]|nr:hypothetical protein [Actinomycetota bacterium]
MIAWSLAAFAKAGFSPPCSALTATTQQAPHRLYRSTSASSLYHRSVLYEIEVEV